LLLVRSTKLTISLAAFMNNIYMWLITRTWGHKNQG